MSRLLRPRLWPPSPVRLERLFVTSNTLSDSRVPWLTCNHVATFLAIILAVGALLTPSSAGAQILLTLLFPPMFYTFFTKALASYENIPLRPDILRRSPNGDAPVLALLVIAIVSPLPIQSYAPLVLIT